MSPDGRVLVLQAVAAEQEVVRRLEPTRTVLSAETPSEGRVKDMPSLGRRIVRTPAMSFYRVILVVLVLSAMACTRAGEVLVLRGATGVPPSIDGKVEATEWSAAARKDFGPIISGAQTITGTVYIMNDAQNLYVAAVIDGDDDFNQSDGFAVYFNNENTNETIWIDGQDCVRCTGTSGFDDWYYNATRKGMAVDTSAYSLGTSDGLARGSRQVASNHFELVHPLNSGDKRHDFSLSVGDIVGFHFMCMADRSTWSNPDWGFGITNNPGSYARFSLGIPAIFKLGNLRIVPGNVGIKSNVTISAQAENTGGQSGSTTYTLKINGRAIESKTVVLEPGQSSWVDFTVVVGSLDPPGTYMVALGELNGSYTVGENLLVMLVGVSLALVIAIGARIARLQRQRFRGQHGEAYRNSVRGPAVGSSQGRV